MTNLVLSAILAMTPAQFVQLTNRVDILWADRTNRIERAKAARDRARMRREGPPTKPYRVRRAGR